MPVKKLIVEVIDVKEKCDAMLKVGDKWTITEDFCIEGKKVCYFAVSSLMPVLFALQTGTEPKEMGLSKEDGVAYMQCSDPGPPLTPGGTVTFKIKFLEEP